MNDDGLDGLLRSLPRAEASAGFTRRVRQRIDGRSAEARRPFAFVRVPAMAAAMVAMIALLGGVAWQRHQEEKRVAEIRAAASRIGAELESLRREAKNRNEIFLGQSGDSEYVLELRPAEAPAGEVRQVSQSY